MLLDHYDTEGLFDEMFAGNGEVRPHYQLMRERLDTMSKEELDQKIRKSGDVCSSGRGSLSPFMGTSRARSGSFPSIPMPRIIPADEWQTIEDGLVQRITALNLFLYDIYHEQKILKDKVIPEEVHPAVRRITALSSWASTCRAIFTSTSAAPI